METSEENLRKRYQALDTDRLRETRRSGGLPELALSLINEELMKRRVDQNSFLESGKGEEEYLDDLQSDRAFVLPRFWLGYLFALIGINMN